MHCMNKVYRNKQKKTGPLVSSQKQRALLVPRFNRRSKNAGFVPPSVYMTFCLFVLLGKHSGSVSSMLWGYGKGLFLWRTVLFASSPARPRPANPPCTPSRRPSGMSRFWIRQVPQAVLFERMAGRWRSPASGNTDLTDRQGDKHPS